MVYKYYIMQLQIVLLKKCQVELIHIEDQILENETKYDGDEYAEIVKLIGQILSCVATDDDKKDDNKSQDEDDDEAEAEDAHDGMDLLFFCGFFGVDVFRLFIFFFARFR